MTIATYSDLTTAVPNWLAKATDTDITGNVADFIAMAEEDIRTDLDAGAMETKNAAFSIGGEFVTLASISSQITSIRRIYLTSPTPDRRLTYVAPQQLVVDYPSETTGMPRVFTIEANELQFRPIPDSTYTAMLTYRKWYDPLATTSTNALLTSWPGIYLFAALRHGAIFLEDAELAATYAAEYQKKLGAFQRASDRLNYSGGVLTIRTDTGTP